MQKHVGHRGPEGAVQQVTVLIGEIGNQRFTGIEDTCRGVYFAGEDGVYDELKNKNGRRNKDDALRSSGYYRLVRIIVGVQNDTTSKHTGLQQTLNHIYRTKGISVRLTRPWCENRILQLVEVCQGVG